MKTISPLVLLRIAERLRFCTHEAASWGREQKNFFCIKSMYAWASLTVAKATVMPYSAQSLSLFSFTKMSSKRLVVELCREYTDLHEAVFLLRTPTKPLRGQKVSSVLQFVVNRTTLHFLMLSM